MALELIGGDIAEEFHGVAAFNQGLTLCRQALQLDGFHLGAILFALPPTLALLVVVQRAFDPVGGAVEEVDGGPEDLAEVGLKAGVAQSRDKGVEDICDGTGDSVAFGQRARVWLIVKRTVAVELEFGQGMIGLGGAV